VFFSLSLTSIEEKVKKLASMFWCSAPLFLFENYFYKWYGTLHLKIAAEQQTIGSNS